MKSALAIFAALSLSACGTLDTVENYKPPVIDKMTPAQQASYPVDLTECQKLAGGAISSFEETAALYSEKEQIRVTEKRRDVRRACLQGRGYAVLY